MGQKLVVLIVEDHPGVREALERIIESWANVDLISCDGFLSAAEWINKTPRIDLLLCDVCLPGGMTGTDLAEIVVQIHPLAAVVMTSADPRSSVPRFTDRYGFIRKPYGRDELFEVVDSALISAGSRRPQRPPFFAKAVKPHLV